MNTWKLETRVEGVRGGAIVTARGRIAGLSADRFAEALRSSQHDARRLIIDLAGVDYISGPGITLLLETVETTETVILCGLGEAVRNTLDLAGVIGRVRIEETRAGAVELCAHLEAGATS